MDYNHQEIEKKWQKYWSENKTFHVEIDHKKPKYYVLDMFPYPSGAGLHVGHPLGYIASDIYSRYKKHLGFNVLHPMGYDAYGLPAEQYAIQTGTHPAVTTEKNIKRYREQMDRIGFSYDWDRQVQTCDPDYYKWTQWTFIQLFKSWYNKKTDKAEGIDKLIELFGEEGNGNLEAACSQEEVFSADEWKQMNEKQQQEVLMNYRLAYLSNTMVNWCPALGTVLANDEVKDGFSERGGHPVERKLMKQWSLRISAYAQRLLDGLEKIDWFESLKEVQRNWIGRSEGASVEFNLEGFDDVIVVFTTRPDTLWGATFMVLAPEHELVEKITSEDRKSKIGKYVNWAKNRSERDRISEVNKITGEFTGAYGINPVNGKKIPIWVADYVLSGYGTGAIMAVPAHDSRDFKFARHFNIPIVQVVKKEGEEESDPQTWDDSYDAKEGVMINSGFITGMNVEEGIKATIKWLEENELGEGRINYRLRDAIFSRQRYWGEPFPIYYKDGMPYPLDESELPLRLPDVDKYLPTESGEPPLARAKDWKTKEGYPLETNTMPGFAGSSGYYLRYMDPKNQNEYFSKEANEYWRNVDLYLGGDEHGTGHLIYARFWNMFLYDLGRVCEEEPFKKLINQGKIQGRSSFVYRLNYEKYAEHLIWEAIKDKKLGVEFVRDFKDGHRQFDFYSREAGLILEIKSQKNLEKLAHYYKPYAREKNVRFLFIPLYDIKENVDHVVNRIKEAIKADDLEINFEHEIKKINPVFVSKDVKELIQFTTPIHVDINLVENDILNIEAFKKWRPEFADAEFIMKDDKYVCGWEVEKMSKSKHNVQNPDELIEKYGADTFRLYEMFLGPLETHKPWDTQGIEGVYRFIRKLWRLYFDKDNNLNISEDQPTKDELKVLHKTIQKVRNDIERFSFNTVVSAFMICVNELTDLKCNKRDILEPLLVLLSPYAPHTAEELWSKLGHRPSIAIIAFPDYKEEYIKENTFEYPVSFNGKLRFKLELPLDISKEDAEKAVLQAEGAQKWLAGKQPKKIIFVPKRIINVVV
ncbi:MAG: leucine--tRNA ligase [Bacteroidales bacterium]|nr:leucine--tRNA ligase [Bacteroidales bacterium]MCF8343048.1 leucine--tRNA ligase [Bacteroidales bacterium]MCF8375911.1 leucine--tRNA ligase [Bacteroidales bacterium]